MTVHLLDMGADTLAALCGADTPFMVSPGLHRHDRTGVDCAACLVIDEATRVLSIAQHPSRSTASPSDSGRVVNIAAHRFNNDLRYRDDAHPMQRQLTPSYVLEPIRKALGSIELDPCTEPDNPTRATMFYTPPVDGADEPWDAATIYVNPPYSKARERWVNRCIEAAATGSSVALLMPSHTDTRLFHRAIGTASHVVFIRGRVKFGVLRSNRRQEAASHPSCVILWNVADVSPMAHLGAVWTLSEVADAIDGVTLDDGETTVTVSRAPRRKRDREGTHSDSGGEG